MSSFERRNPLSRSDHAEKRSCSMEHDIVKDDMRSSGRTCRGSEGECRKGEGDQVGPSSGLTLRKRVVTICEPTTEQEVRTDATKDCGIRRSAHDGAWVSRT